MNIKLMALGPLVLLLLAGCVMPAPAPLAERTARRVQTNNDGSTTQGLEIIANYNQRRVFTLQTDPIGAAVSGGEDVHRGLSAPWRGLPPATQVRQSAPLRADPMAQPQLRSSADVCAPPAAAAPQGHWIYVDEHGNRTMVPR